MGKFIMFLFIVYFGALAYFGILNRDYYTVVLTKDHVYEVHKVVLVLISSTVGAMLMLFAFVVKDTRRFIRTLQQQKKMKKDDRIKALYARAMDAYFAQRWDDAKTVLDQILREAPEHIDALLKIGSVYYNSRDFTTAFHYFKRAYAVDPNQTETLFALADVKEAVGAYGDALGYIDELLNVDEDNIRALYRRRDLLEKMERWDDLCDSQKNIIKLKRSEQGKAREQEKLKGFKYEQARSCLENGQLDKAQKGFRMLLRLDRGFIPAHLGLAEVILREEHPDEAVNYLEEIFFQTRSLIVLARIEDMLINIGEPARLLSIYKSALASDPDNNNLKLLLGKLYYRLEMLDDAADVLQSIDTGAATYPEISKILGNIYLKRGQAELAAQEFKKAIDIKKAFRLPYCCTNCGFYAVEWSGRCPSCKSWATYQFDLFDTCKVMAH